MGKKQLVSSLVKYERKYIQENIEEEKGAKDSNYSKLLKKLI